MNRQMTSGLANVMRLISRLAWGRVLCNTHLVSEGTIQQVDCRVKKPHSRRKHGVKRSIQ